MKTLIGVLVILLCVLQYRLWFGDGSVQEVSRLRAEVREADAELVELRSRNQALRAEVEDLKSGLDAIEERARSGLGMIDKDETFYRFVRERRAESAEAAAASGANDADAVEASPSTATATSASPAAEPSR